MVPVVAATASTGGLRIADTTALDATGPRVTTGRAGGVRGADSGRADQTERKAVTAAFAVTAAMGVAVAVEALTVAAATRAGERITHAFTIFGAGVSEDTGAPAGIDAYSVATFLVVRTGGEAAVPVAVAAAQARVAIADTPPAGRVTGMPLLTGLLARVDELTGPVHACLVGIGADRAGLTIPPAGHVVPTVETCLFIQTASRAAPRTTATGFQDADADPTSRAPVTFAAVSIQDAFGSRRLPVGLEAPRCEHQKDHGQTTNEESSY